MSETHEQWLARLAEQSKAKQERFMKDIAAKLRHPRLTEKPVQPYRGAPDFWQAFNWSQEEKEAQFIDNFQSVGGHTARLASMEEAKAFIVNKTVELGAKYIVRQNESELAALELEEELKRRLPEAELKAWNTDEEHAWMAEAAQADIGIVMADHAVAYTGSITVLSANNKGRSVSLLPTVMFFIIPVDRLHTRLGEVLGGFDQAGREALPAGIHFISGPSRSSDIENDLTIGVHGPGVVYALLVG